MTEHGEPGDDAPRQSDPVKGRMLLYRQPELLSQEDHGHLGLRSAENRFDFARQVRSVPIVTNEFRSVQRFCPIVFSSLEEPMPFAVVGLFEDVNLFVDEAGRWSVPGYIPVYLRTYPFALATAAEDRYAVIVDRAASMVTEDPAVPFYQGAELSPPIAERIELCRNHQAEKQRTQAFCETLVRLELLAPYQANQTVNGRQQALAHYYAVDPHKLESLDRDVLAELLRDGSLAAIMAHRFSLDLWQELLRLRKEHRVGASD